MDTKWINYNFKLQVSLGKTVETSGKSSGKCKKIKISPTTTEKPTTVVSDSTELSKESVALPDFNNFQTKSQDSPEIKSKNFSQKPASSQISRSNSNESDIYDINQIANESELKPNIAGKLPLPRLPHVKSKQSLAPPKPVILPTPKNKIRNQLKYKNIQPRLTKCDNFYAQERHQTQVDSSDVLTPLGDDQLKDIDILTRERLISVSNVDKDALDDYLHGGNNSQEQEEELLRYFGKNNSSSESLSEVIQQSTIAEDEHSNGSKSDKLSQLRLLLEQNYNPTQMTTENQQSTFIKLEKPPFATLPSSTTIPGNFSFLY